MRVYLAAAMTSPDRDLPAIRFLRDHLESGGHTVPTRHVAEPDGRQQDAHLTERQLAQRDAAWLEACDALVAEVSTPSHGVGVEVTLAVARGRPVLLLHRAGIVVSRLLLGLDGVVTVPYATLDAAARAVDAFLASGGSPALGSSARP
jgi:2'-deoxynucleoside 5'-phosphate N-hydrolase